MENLFLLCFGRNRFKLFLMDIVWSASSLYMYHKAFWQMLTCVKKCPL